MLVVALLVGCKTDESKFWYCPAAGDGSNVDMSFVCRRSADDCKTLRCIPVTSVWCNVEDECFFSSLLCNAAGSGCVMKTP